MFNPERKREEFEIELHNFINSSEGDAYFENERIKEELKQIRYKHFEKFLESNDFDKLMYRLILEHDDEWREKCWHNGCEPYPNNKLGFVIDYVTNNFDTIDVPQLQNSFNTQIWFFKGYYFRITFGQGVVFDLYNGDDFSHLLHA